MRVPHQIFFTEKKEVFVNDVMHGKCKLTVSPKHFWYLKKISDCFLDEICKTWNIKIVKFVLSPISIHSKMGKRSLRCNNGVKLCIGFFSKHCILIL